MTFKDLKNYLLRKMSMQHIYQPLFIKTLLSSEKPVTARQIAQIFLAYDQSQVDYYEVVTRRMPAVVLEKNGVISKVDKGYVLKAEALTAEERLELIRICDQKTEDFVASRGGQIWDHRDKLHRPIPGSVRYAVLSRAGGRCELCGASATETALHVDHIVPKNIGGKDEVSNYQALCLQCNTNKRDTDSTDFRELKALYDHREKGCIFCHPAKSSTVDSLTLAYVYTDKYPVTPSHLLIIPARHVSSVFELYSAELNACLELLKKHQALLQNSDRSILGFNIGVNVNEAGGQTIPHCHWHLIPRRANDVPNPRGGIRNIIPGKGDY